MLKTVSLYGADIYNPYSLFVASCGAETFNKDSSWFYNALPQCLLHSNEILSPPISDYKYKNSLTNNHRHRLVLHCKTHTVIKM